MEAILKMEKKAQLVYVCPYCRSPAWFNKPHELVTHLYKNHLTQSLYTITQNSKTQVRKKVMKWNIT